MNVITTGASVAAVSADSRLVRLSIGAPPMNGVASIDLARTKPYECDEPHILENRISGAVL
jgi:hypothetical protein